MRTSKTVNGVESTYLYLDGKLHGEVRDGHHIHYSYDSYGNLSVIKYYKNDTDYNVFYVMTNVFGDVISLHNANGTMVASYEYDSWGNVIAMTDTTGIGIATINPIRYRGYYYDSETGLYYLSSRYYDPQVGRFLNADGYLFTGRTMLGHNLFAYCNNNPIIYTDPSGESFISAVLLTLMVIGITVSLSSSTANPEKEPIDPKQPPPEQSGYKPPKKNKKLNKVNNPNGPGQGWPADDGGVWVPNNQQHGGPGWTVQYPGGYHEHHYPDGHIRYAPVNLPNETMGVALIAVGVVGVTLIVADDASGIGTIDDLAIPVFCELIREGSACFSG